MLMPLPKKSTPRAQRRRAASAILLGVLVSSIALVLAAGWMHTADRAQRRGNVTAGDRRASPQGGTDSAQPSAVTFHTEIAPLVHERCAVCHRPGEAAPFPLVSYHDVRSRAEQIVDVTQSRYMPPWKPEPGYAEFVGNRRLSDHQIELIRQWVQAGAPEGRRENRPPLPKLSESWQLGEPDLVFRLPEPYTLPAEGNDVFRNFVIPAPVSQVRYVKAIELRPGNAKIAHHGLLKIDRTSTSRRLDARDPGLGYNGMRMVGAHDPDGQFIVWTPGRTPLVEPDDMAWRLERGTDLVLQLHMKPTGKPEIIQPAVGLYFTDQPPTRTPTVFQLYSAAIDIPPGVNDYTIEDSFVLPVDAEVLGIFPHAHYIGREMRAYAELPDGTRLWLLHIKDWDFNWQDDYRYASPVPISAGAKIVMHYTYDNSADNPRNPNHPPKRVVAGDESTDEMGSLTLRVLTKSEPDRLKLDEMLAREQLRKASDRDAEAHYALATSLQSQGRLDEAIVHYRRALGLAPDHAPSHCNLGVLLKMRGDLQGAASHYREALSIDPELADAHTNLGNVLTQMGQSGEAIRCYEQALAIQPDSAGAHYNLAFLLERIGRASEAVPHYREAIHLDPDNAAPYAHLAWILATHHESNLRNGEEAVRIADVACQLTDWKHHIPLSSLAAAYAEAGQFTKAVDTAQRALDRATTAGNTTAADTIRNQLATYRQHLPYREPR